MTIEKLRLNALTLVEAGAMADSIERLLKAIRSFERADTEFHRASNAAEQPRLSNAGTRYAVSKIRLFSTAKKVRETSPGRGDGD